MPSSTSSSEPRFVLALVVTFGALLVGWEAILRHHGSATVDVAMRRPAMTVTTSPGEEWVIFGNCLMMTGVSPRQLNEALGRDHERVIVNIAAHEQSPIAFFEYLRTVGHYPDVIVTNVSSWLNGTNFAQEGMLVTAADPLSLGQAGVAASSSSGRDAFRGEADPGRAQLQRRTETTLSNWAGTHVLAVGHRYHLFDYSLFVGTLATSANLDDSLYQLNMQSWFRVKGSETDGQGWLGLALDYRSDWDHGLERMADRSLQRLRLQRLLTPEYWTLLEENVRHFREHGTEVVVVRMPEHARIREFNDRTYALPDQIRGITERTGASSVDLSRLGTPEGVRLFDAVHPDAPAAEVITRAIANALRSQGLTGRRSGQPRPGTSAP